MAGSFNHNSKVNPTEIPTPGKGAIQVERAAIQKTAGCSEERLCITLDTYPLLSTKVTFGRLMVLLRRDDGLHEIGHP